MGAHHPWSWFTFGDCIWMCYNGTDHRHCVPGKKQCSGKLLWIWISATGTGQPGLPRSPVHCSDVSHHLWSGQFSTVLTKMARGRCQLSLQQIESLKYLFFIYFILCIILAEKDQDLLLSVYHNLTAANRLIGFAANNTLYSGQGPICCYHTEMIKR